MSAPLAPRRFQQSHTNPDHQHDRSGPNASYVDTTTVHNARFDNLDHDVTTTCHVGTLLRVTARDAGNFLAAVPAGLAGVDAYFAAAIVDAAEQLIYRLDTVMVLITYVEQYDSHQRQLDEVIIIRDSARGLL